MPQTLLDFLIQKFPTAKRQTLRRMVDERRVEIDGTPARNVKQIVEPAHVVIVREHRKSPGPGTLRPPVAIVFEDADLLVIDKPPGLLTSTVPGERRPTALALLRDYVAQREPAARVGLIHRLDRDASGLLVFSKNHEAFRSLKQQFFEHSVDRIYTAVVEGKLKPEKDRIRSRLVERADGTVYSTKRADDGEEAITDYQVIRSAGELTLVRVTLQTGRKHQIRVHLSERGAAIVGDTMYATKTAKSGGTLPKPSSRLLLLAGELSFDHPRTGKRLRFELEMIDDIRKLFR